MTGNAPLPQKLDIEGEGYVLHGRASSFRFYLCCAASYISGLLSLLPRVPISPRICVFHVPRIVDSDFHITGHMPWVYGRTLSESLFWGKYAIRLLEDKWVFEFELKD